MQGKSADQIRAERRAAELRAACDRNPEAFVAQTEWLIRLMKAAIVALAVLAFALTVLAIALLSGAIVPWGFVVVMVLAYPLFCLWRALNCVIFSEWPLANNLFLNSQNMPELLRIVEDYCDKLGGGIPDVIVLSPTEETMVSIHRTFRAHGKFKSCLWLNYVDLAMSTPEQIRAVLASLIPVVANGFLAKAGQVRVEAELLRLVFERPAFSKLCYFFGFDWPFFAMLKVVEARVAASAAARASIGASQSQLIFDAVSTGEAWVTVSVLPGLRASLAFEAVKETDWEAGTAFPSYLKRVSEAARTDVSEKAVDGIKLFLLGEHSYIWASEPFDRRELPWTAPAAPDDEAAIRAFAAKVGGPVLHSAFDAWATPELRRQMESLEEAIHQQEKDSLEAAAKERESVEKELRGLSQGIPDDPGARAKAASMANDHFYAREHKLFLPLAKKLSELYPDEPRIALWLGFLLAQSEDSRAEGIELMQAHFQKVPPVWSKNVADELFRMKLLAQVPQDLRQEVEGLAAAEKVTAWMTEEVQRSRPRAEIEPLELEPSELELLQSALETQSEFSAVFGATYRSGSFPGQVIHLIFLQPAKVPFLPDHVPPAWIERQNQLSFALPPGSNFVLLEPRGRQSARIGKLATKIWSVNGK